MRRSRRQKTTINELSRENARLRRTAKASRNRLETLEAQLAKLHATRAVLSKALFGRKSEKQETPRSGRRRGQQRGAPGHGRSQRPGLEERTEVQNPPADARACSCCGRRYAATGAEQSTLVEIESRAHKRVIRHPRWRRTCDCASSPVEVSAPPLPRLFANTPYGASVWSRFLFERYACLRPLQRVAAWMSETRGCRSPRGRWPTACPASCHCSSRWPTRSSRTRTQRRCAMPTRPRGACRRFATRAGRAAPGCGSRSVATRPTSTSTRAAVPRRRRSCSPRPCCTRSSSATATAPTRSWRAFAGGWSPWPGAGPINGATLSSARPARFS